MTNQLALTFPGQITKTSLSIKAGTPYDELLEIGKKLSAVHSQGRWWLGDLAIHVKTRYPDDYDEWLEKSAYGKENMRQYIRVAEQIPKSRRKSDRPGISWSHHQVVASMPPEDADAWLLESIENKYTVKELKRAIARSKEVPDDGTSQPSFLGTLEVAIVPTEDQKREVMQDLRQVADLGSDDEAGGDVLLVTQRDSTILDKHPLEIANFLREVVHEKLGVEDVDEIARADA